MSSMFRFAVVLVVLAIAGQAKGLNHRKLEENSVPEIPTSDNQCGDKPCDQVPPPPHHHHHNKSPPNVDCPPLPPSLPYITGPPLPPYSPYTTGPPGNLYPVNMNESGPHRNFSMGVVLVLMVCGLLGVSILAF